MISSEDMSYPRPVEASVGSSETKMFSQGVTTEVTKMSVDGSEFVRRRTYGDVRWVMADGGEVGDGPEVLLEALYQLKTDPVTTKDIKNN